MITTETQPKRGQSVYWKKSTTYSEMAFIALVAMPHPPNAVKVAKAGDEYILKDCEVFLSVKEVFCDKYSIELGLLNASNAGRGLIKHVAKELEMPYSRILRIANKARELGVTIPASKKT